MFYPQNQIIIVDDNPDHLTRLSKPFHDNGIGCKAFQYDVNYSAPLKNVRVAFFDIRINPTGGGSAGQRLNDIALAIKQYVHVDNGPFALIFWTANKDEISAIKKFIEERHPDCPKPFLVDFIDKDVFLADPEKLHKKLGEVLSNQTLQILFEFEKVAGQAASLTINQIFNIIPRKDAWGETADFIKNFELLFSKLAIVNSGYGYAKENPDKGVVAALLPVFNHHIESTYTSDKWKKYLTTLAESKSHSGIHYPADFEEGKLNAIFHLEKSTGNKEVRGVVISIDSQNPDTLKTFNINNINEWFNSFIPFTKEKKDLKEQVRAGSQLVAVEISAACDYSNHKKRINKYILGFITPVFNTASLDEEHRPECSYHVGGMNFKFNKRDFQLWLNLNFVFGTVPTDPRLGKCEFVLRKEIMDMIGNKYAGHISRIGITNY